MYTPEEETPDIIVDGNNLVSPPLPSLSSALCANIVLKWFLILLVYNPILYCLTKQHSLNCLKCVHCWINFWSANLAQFVRSVFMITNFFEKKWKNKSHQVLKLEEWASIISVINLIKSFYLLCVLVLLLFVADGIAEKFRTFASLFWIRIIGSDSEWAQWKTCASGRTSKALFCSFLCFAL